MLLVAKVIGLIALTAWLFVVIIAVYAYLRGKS